MPQRAVAKPYARHPAAFSTIALAIQAGLPALPSLMAGFFAGPHCCAHDSLSQLMRLQT